MSTDHRGIAATLIQVATDTIQDVRDTTPDIEFLGALQVAAVTAGLATASALLAVEKHLGELVEQQRIANVIAAYGTGPTDLDAVHDAEIYVRARIDDIVQPAAAEPSAHRQLAEARADLERQTDCNTELRRQLEFALRRAERAEKKTAPEGDRP